MNTYPDLHLYINGVYWGLYNPVERPDASFSETNFGGDKENWDAINTGGGNPTQVRRYRSLTECTGTLGT